MNEDSGRRMNFSSLFRDVLLIGCGVLAFSSETVKYLMNVFVRGVTCHTNNHTNPSFAIGLYRIWMAAAKSDLRK